LCFDPTQSVLRLRGVLGQFGEPLPMTLRRSDNLHLLPVVRKLSTAVQTSHVGSRQCRGWGTALSTTNRYWKAIASVPATEKRIDQFGDHDSTFHIRAGLLEPLGIFTLSSRFPIVCAGNHQILRFRN